MSLNKDMCAKESKSIAEKIFSLKRQQHKVTGIKPKTIMNAWMRLIDLKHVKERNFEFSNLNVSIEENNRIAMNTLDRKLGGKAELLPPLDNMIFNIALQKAQRVNRRGHHQEGVSFAEDLKRLLARMKQQGFAVNATDTFVDLSKESMGFVLGQPRVVEQDPLSIDT